MNDTARKSSRFGWWALALFMLGGLLLESLHLIKAPFYFEVSIRRELWTLAHAHGAVLALVNVLFGLTAERWFENPRTMRWTARGFMAGALLMPAGFFLGGIGNSESDPSLWIIATPIGALCVIVSAVLTGLAMGGKQVSITPAEPSAPKKGKPGSRRRGGRGG